MNSTLFEDCRFEAHVTVQNQEIVSFIIILSRELTASALSRIREWAGSSVAVQFADTLHYAISNDTHRNWLVYRHTTCM